MEIVLSQPPGKACEQMMPGKPVFVMDLVQSSQLLSDLTTRTGNKGENCDVQ